MTRKLHRLIVTCRSARSGTVRGGRLRLPAGDGTTAVEVEALPWRSAASSSRAPGEVPRRIPTATLYIRDRAAERETTERVLQERFSLTPAEARVALELVPGDGRAAAARRLGVSLSTVRTHMTRLFEKTGVTRQAELVRLISNLPPA